MKCQAVKGDVFSENRFVFNSWGDFAREHSQIASLRTSLIIYDVIFHTMRKYAPAIPSILLLFCHLFLHLVSEKGFSLRTKCAIKAMADHFSIKLYAVVHFIILTWLRTSGEFFRLFHPQSRLYEMFILGSGRLFSVNRFYFRKERKKKFSSIEKGCRVLLASFKGGRENK